MSASAKISFISGPLASTYSLFAVFAFFLTLTSELATPPSLIGSVSPADFPLAQPMGSKRCPTAPRRENCCLSTPPGTWDRCGSTPSAPLGCTPSQGQTGMPLYVISAVSKSSGGGRGFLR